MLRRLFNTCLLRPEDFKPSQEYLEVIGAFNPGVVATKDGIVLLVRIAEQAKEKRPGHVSMPRWDVAAQRTVIDWMSAEEITPVDVRVVRRKNDGLVRLTFISHLRLVRSKDGKTIDSIEPIALTPEKDYEEFGVEDPRITPIGDLLYITYVAVSRHGATTALASTRDFKSFQRHGIIFCTENKDVVLFPEKIQGEYWALHRPNGATPFTSPEMWIARSPDLIHWGQHEPFLGGSESWDIGRIGAGAPPIRTERGWLEMYHGNSKSQQEKGIGIYCGALLLMDLDDPRKIVARSGSVFVPETEYEKTGFVPNVVFPTSIVARGENALIYYGAADTVTGVVEFSMAELLSNLKQTPHRS